MTSTNFTLRYFYFLFACLVYSIWRLVDGLVKLDIEDYEIEGEPVVGKRKFKGIIKEGFGFS